MRFSLVSPRIVIGCALAVSGVAATFVACSDQYRPLAANGGRGGTTTTSSTTTHGTGGGVTLVDACPSTCSNDLKNVIDCNGVVQMACPPTQGCANGACMDNPCAAAELSKSSYGCDYWALKTAQRPEADGACFAAFVANTWGLPVHLTVEYQGQVLDPTTFAAIPVVSGPDAGQVVSYQPYVAGTDAGTDAGGTGIPTGQVAILFLSRSSKGATVVNCPITAAINGPAGETGVAGTGVGDAFHIKSDYPVVAYQMTPYGGGQAAFTGATLLLPTSAWDTNYIAINAYKSAEGDGYPGGLPSLDVVAYMDNTQVTILPNAPIVGTVDGGVPAAADAGAPVTYTLNAGQFLQITQTNELTGSPITSTQPIGVFGASAGMAVPLGQADIDSAQQQIPPVRAMGNEYVAVRYRGRGAALDGGSQNESVPWRLVGAVKGTTLTWLPSTPPGAPTSIDLGTTAEFTTPGPFVVQSQDTSHPFYLGGYMTGGGGPDDGGPGGFNGEGDPDWVNVIPPQQYLDHYVFFTDPSYPETNLVLVRTPSKLGGTFADVTVTCAGSAGPQTVPASSWTPIGKYQYARFDISTGNFTGVNGCTNGRQEIESAQPFGVTVWGWGATQQTQLVSYSYPAGAGFQPINMVVVPTTQ